MKTGPSHGGDGAVILCAIGRRRLHQLAQSLPAASEINRRRARLGASKAMMSFVSPRCRASASSSSMASHKRLGDVPMTTADWAAVPLLMQRLTDDAADDGNIIWDFAESFGLNRHAVAAAVKAYRHASRTMH